MPAQGIHGFPCCQQQSRGWRAFARHDVKAVPIGQLIEPVVSYQRPSGLTDREFCPVMPTEVGIHDFATRKQGSRGWRAFARHDDVGIADESASRAAGIILLSAQ
jgi:hypothetical protein